MPRDRFSGTYRLVDIPEFCHWLARGWTITSTLPRGDHGLFSVMMRAPDGDDRGG